MIEVLHVLGVMLAVMLTLGLGFVSIIAMTHYVLKWIDND